MKKIFSLVALVFVLSSFSVISPKGIDDDSSITENSMDIVNNIIEIPKSNFEISGDTCFDNASYMANLWMENTGGSWNESVAVFNFWMNACENGFR